MNSSRRLGVIAVASGMDWLALGGEQVPQERYATPNFWNVDVTIMANSVTEFTGRVVVIDPSVRKRVNWQSRTPFTPEEYYQQFVRVLTAAGLRVRDDAEATFVSSETSDSPGGAR
jgi:type II secretory pathway component GspD/PulD (secretin)